MIMKHVAELIALFTSDDSNDVAHHKSLATTTTECVTTADTHCCERMMVEKTNAVLESANAMVH